MIAVVKAILSALVGVAFHFLFDAPIWFAIFVVMYVSDKLDDITARNKP